MTSLMASLIASLTTPLIPPLIASLISDGLSDGLSDALIRGTHPRASIAGLRHLCSSLYPVLFHGVSVSQQLTHSLGGGGAWDDDDDGCGGGPEGTCLLTGLKLGLKLTLVSLPRSPKMSAFNLDCFRCHGTHSASSHWLTEQCGEKAPKLALAVARTVQTGSASTLAFFLRTKLASSRYWPQNSYSKLALPVSPKPQTDYEPSCRRPKLTTVWDD